MFASFRIFQVRRDVGGRRNSDNYTIQAFLSVNHDAPKVQSRYNYDNSEHMPTLLKQLQMKFTT